MSKADAAARANAVPRDGARARARAESLRAAEAAIMELERTLWNSDCDPSLLERYQAAYREMETRLAGQGEDPRRKIVVVVSVADRPQLLKNCLDSLAQLCDLFRYGGLRNGRYPKVAVVVADDSRDEECMARHRELASACADRGIETHYCGHREQLEWIDALPAAQRKGLKRVLGEAPRAAFYHKGASVMRNITYLKLRELWRQANEPLLFHFIDSDQEFRIKIATAVGDRDVYALSYFHALDRLFSGTDAVVATGKVVGDPPVSSSVMMSGFLDDVLAFVQRAANTRPKDACGFHASQGTHEDGGAIYHDMPELFGFSPAQTSFDYSCDLAGPHTNSDCLDHFATGLNRFFYGEHPTRKTRYAYAGTALGIAPARTVYSGNYMMRPEGLRYFLPFAPLRLRMPGPTLGRIVKAELAGRFVAVNLPMLHQRTVGDNGETEFRPGVESLQDTVDISGEFIRQFFGDVMLFSIEKLTAMGFPQVQPDEASLIRVLDETRASLLKSYNVRQEAIAQKVARIEACVDDPRAWWRTEEGAGAALYRLRAFLTGVTHNFGPGSAGYAEINDAARWGERRAQMAQAIAAYIEDRTAWESVVFGE